ncbi:putative peroxidase [Dioscorea sansibarensis]
MALSVTFIFVLTTLLLSPLVCIASTDGNLNPKFYDHSCPKAKKIIQSIVAEAGCDASVLLDSSGTIISRWTKLGGAPWERRDSLGASISGSNHNIPSPNDTLPTIITKFKLKGLNLVDLVALSGSHTTLGKQGALVSDKGSTTKLGKGFTDTTLNMVYANQLKSRCPKVRWRPEPPSSGLG